MFAIGAAAKRICMLTLYPHPRPHHAHTFTLNSRHEAQLQGLNAEK